MSPFLVNRNERKKEVFMKTRIRRSVPILIQSHLPRTMPTARIFCFLVIIIACASNVFAGHHQAEVWLGPGHNNCSGSDMLKFKIGNCSAVPGKWQDKEELKAWICDKIAENKVLYRPYYDRNRETKLSACLLCFGKGLLFSSPHVYYQFTCPDIEAERNLIPEPLRGSSKP